MKKGFLKQLSAGMLVILMMFSLVACSKDTAKKNVEPATQESSAESEQMSEEDLPVLNVAVMPFLTSVPVKYIIEKGIDVKNGFKIKTVYFANGGAMNEALASDQWEVGHLSAAAVNALAIYGAYDVADIAHSSGGLYTLVSPDSPIAKVKGTNPDFPDVYGDAKSLKGAVIATSTGTISHLNVNKWLEALGLTPDDVKIVSMDFPSAYQALKTGNCDVAALNPPTSFQAVDDGFVVTSSLDSLNVPMYDSVISSAKALKEKPDLVKKYIKSIFEANDALQADPGMAAQELFDWYKENGSDTTLDACKVEIKTRPFVTTDEAKKLKIGDAIIATGEFWVSQKLLEKDKFPEISKHIDDSLVKSALGF